MACVFVLLPVLLDAWREELPDAWWYIPGAVLAFAFGAVLLGGGMWLALGHAMRWPKW